MAYGLRPGYCGQWGKQVIWRCSHTDTGGPYYPVDLRTIYDDPESEISYATWMANLAAAGVKVVELGLTGRNRDSGEIYAWEPPPSGTFNIAHSDLNEYAPDDLTTYRAHQVTHPPDATHWANSNFKAACDAAAANGIQFYVAAFEYNEFVSDWAYHAWNANNKYVDGTNCEAQDQGFLTNAYEFFTEK